MPKGRFQVNAWLTSGDNISLEVDKIGGTGGPEYPRLSIPLEFTLRPQESKEEIRTYSLLWLKSSLFFLNAKIGEGISDFIFEYSWPGAGSRQIFIEIPLDSYRIEKIEEKRKGDIEFRLSGSALIVEHPCVPRAGPQEKQQYKRDVKEFNKGSFDITFVIPQSHWIDKVLPGLGYGKIKIIEVLIPRKIVPEIFNKALMEIEQSQRYFLEGDYDKVVAHCRNAVELIPEALPVDLSHVENPSFNNRVEMFLKECLSELMNDAKRKSLEKMIAAIWKLGSITHHPSSLDYFNRADAEAVLQITTVLLAYVGKLLERREK